ncbi:glycoside hydrolase family 43 protein [Puniceicoccus vermicola]|uniref:Family 43 glycosylhydrolase n=1 Tax=Puniceicoccus vermicola TaxID=388746 RepID=A0A7X1AXT5_9BACT|nr:glycoside hydrolase family 43 protein [Puniceicoccus vermicola]MBC2601862.1 family 43 glycosylhydrolase [Puniceicoccus vermicola]
MSEISVSNPILPGMHPDPTICRVEDVFYLATSSFGQFPGVPLYRSRDLQTWEFVRHILSRPSQLDFVEEQKLGNAGIFAPTLRYHDGTFYLITTQIGKIGHFIVTAVDPAGEWSDPIWLDADHQGGIDPSLTFLEDGTVLCQVTGDGRWGEPQGIVQFEIDPKTGRGITSRQFISKGFGWKATEGPHLFSRGDYWYLLTAEGGTESGHRVAIGRSSSPWGPWEPCPHNPILTHSGLESAIQNTGHADFIEDENGKWWVVFLGVRPQGYPPVHVLGRETFLAPVEWSESGWPIVNDGKPVSLSEEANKESGWKDSFVNEKGELGPRWVSVGRAFREIYELPESKGLRLLSRSESLSTPLAKAWVGVRMTQPQVVCECEVCPESLNAELGISAFMEHFGYYSLGIVEKSDGSGVYARFSRRVIDLEQVEEREIPGQSSYRLRIELATRPDGWNAGDPSRLIFSVATEEGEWLEIGAGASRLLSTEILGGFGGLFAGVYCLGKPGSTGRVLWFSQR